MYVKRHLTFAAEEEQQLHLEFSVEMGEEIAAK